MGVQKSRRFERCRETGNLYTHDGAHSFGDVPFYADLRKAPRAAAKHVSFRLQIRVLSGGISAAAYGAYDNNDARGGEDVAKTGRPATYETEEEMQEVIDAYFAECLQKPILDEDGNAITDKRGQPLFYPAKPPTITGLALALGFTSRQALLNYQAKEEFIDTVTRAKSRVEEFAEQMLYSPGAANGAKFNLTNNFEGWTEKQQIDGNLNVFKLEELL